MESKVTALALDAFFQISVYSNLQDLDIDLTSIPR